MSRRRVVIALVLAGASLAACEAQSSPAVDVVPATVARIVDGDTVELEIAGEEIVVRLLAIDAPEAGECGDVAATERLAQLLPIAAAVDVVPDPVADVSDRYGRLLAYLELDGVDVGAQLVTEGLTGVWWPAREPEPTRAGAYMDARDQARDTAAGSWGTCEMIGRS